jgi:hypothetical protein
MATDLYKTLSLTFFVRKALNLLTPKLELELVAALDEAWATLSAAERREVRAWLPAEAIEYFELGSEVQAAPPRDEEAERRLRLRDMVLSWIEQHDDEEPDWDPRTFPRFGEAERLVVEAWLPGELQSWGPKTHCHREPTDSHIAEAKCKLDLLELFILRARGLASYEYEIHTIEILAKKWETYSIDTNEDVYAWIDRHKYLPLDELLATVLSIGDALSPKPT